jgi:hypothetical protein
LRTTCRHVAHELPIDAEPHAIDRTVYRRAWVVDEEGSMTTGLGRDWPFAGHTRQRITLVLSMDLSWPT